MGNFPTFSDKNPYIKLEGQTVLLLESPNTEFEGRIMLFLDHSKTTSDGRTVPLLRRDITHLPLSSTDDRRASIIMVPLIGMMR